MASSLLKTPPPFERPAQAGGTGVMNSIGKPFTQVNRPSLLITTSNHQSQEPSRFGSIIHSLDQSRANRCLSPSLRTHSTKFSPPKFPKMYSSFSPNFPKLPSSTAQDIPPAPRKQSFVSKISPLLNLPLSRSHDDDLSFAFFLSRINHVFNRYQHVQHFL